MEANFTRKKISKKDKLKKAIKAVTEKKPDDLNQSSEKVQKKLKINVSIAIPVIIILILVAGIVKAISSIDFTVFLKVAGEELQADSFGHTNFLILGTGDVNHEGSDLTDTIMVASLDMENKLVTMISIPRDYYIEDQLIGNSRINEVYYYAQNYFESSRKGLDHLKGKVEELMGIPIHYWIKIDFNGFKDLIDALGGIDVYVEEAIYDPYYPKDGTFLYETFSIEAGQHHMDGEIALKYARSRKTTSDFDRARRQQQIIYAIKEKALQTETILSQDKISELLTTLGNNITTNIKVDEILTLGAYANEFSEDQISHRLIHDDPFQCGGFLYTPDRTYYNGMFVLIPAGGEKYIHWYSDLNLNTPYIKPENTKIHILNGTSIGGVAAETKEVLQRYCFDVVKFGNAKEPNLPETTYYYKEVYDENGKLVYGRPDALDFLQKYIPGKESTTIPEEYKEYVKEADLVIEIGENYLNAETYMSDPFYGMAWPPIYNPSPASDDSTDNI